MDLGVAGRGGARRRTRRRQRARAQAAAGSQPQAAAPEAAAPQAAAGGDEQTVLLSHLSDLHQAGILTDEEFAAKKVLVVEKF